MNKGEDMNNNDLINKVNSLLEENKRLRNTYEEANDPIYEEVKKLDTLEQKKAEELLVLLQIRNKELELEILRKQYSGIEPPAIPAPVPEYERYDSAPTYGYVSTPTYCRYCKRPISM